MTGRRRLIHEHLAVGAVRGYAVSGRARVWHFIRADHPATHPGPNAAYRWPVMSAFCGNRVETQAMLERRAAEELATFGSTLVVAHPMVERLCSTCGSSRELSEDARKLLRRPVDAGTWEAAAEHLNALYRRLFPVCIGELAPDPLSVRIESSLTRAKVTLEVACAQGVLPSDTVRTSTRRRP